MILRRLFILVAACLVTMMLHAQETPQSLAKKLQEQFLNAPEVSLAFDLENEGRVTIWADAIHGNIRIESPSMLIISDGHTVWNYQKHDDRVTIDNVANSSAFKDPASLFRFADNYTASITTWDGTSRCTLELTPNAVLQALLKSAGEIQKITLSLRISKQKVEITRASAASSKGTTRAEKLTIKTLRKIQQSDFIFKPKASTKVIDLRE